MKTLESFEKVEPEEFHKQEPDEERTADEKKKKRKRKRKKKTDEIAVEAGDEGTYTAYIEGISYDASEVELENFFTPCGPITDVRMPKWQDSGKPRGYAHIDFASSAGLSSALKLDGQTMMGRYLKISLANAKSSFADSILRPKPPGCKTIFVKNLPYDASEKQVEEAFQVCGKITHVRLPRWGHTGNLKGIGYIQFRKESSTEIAVKKRGQISVGDRLLLVDYDSGQMKKSFKTGDGRKWNKVHGKEHKRFKSGPRL